MSNSASPGAIWGQFKPKEQHQKPIQAISARGSKSALGNQWTVLALRKWAKLDSEKWYCILLTETAQFVRVKRAPLVQKVDNDNAVGFPNIYPMDSDLSDGFWTILVRSFWFTRCIPEIISRFTEMKRTINQTRKP